MKHLAQFWVGTTLISDSVFGRRQHTLDGNDGVFYAGAAQIAIDYPEDLLARLDAPRQRKRKA